MNRRLLPSLKKNTSLPGRGIVIVKKIQQAWTLALCLVIPSFILSQDDATFWLHKAQDAHINNPDSAIFCANRSLDEISASSPDSIKPLALFIKGWNLQLLGNCQKAIETYKLLVDDPEVLKTTVLYARAIGRIGVCWRDLGRFDSAIRYLQQYDKLIDLYVGTSAIEAKIELGELYRAMGRLDVSNEYKLAAIDRARESGNRVDRIMTLYYYLDDNTNHIGNAEFAPYLEEYLTLVGKPRNDGTVDYSHGSMLLMKYSGDEKLAFLQSAVQSLELSEGAKGYLFMLNELVKNFEEKGQYDFVVQYAQKGLRTAMDRNEIPYVLQFHQFLYRGHEAQDEYRKALEHLHAFTNLKDSLYTATVMSNVDSLKIKYQTAQKEQQIADQQLEIQQRLYQRNILFAGLGLVVLFALFLVLFLWNRNRLNKKLARQYARLQKQRIHQLEQEKQILAMNAMLEGQEAERIRIARDLHDGLGGLLGTIKTRFSRIEREGYQGEEKKIYDQVNALINTASAEVRRISHHMAPHALRLSGLKDAIGDYCRQLSNQGSEIAYQWYGPDNSLDSNVEIMLYRIVQELMSNAIRHAGANEILLQVNRHDEELVLLVEDDGTGFAMDGIEKGLGLESIKSRVEFIHGDLDIDSRPGQGTSVTVKVPLVES